MSNLFSLLATLVNLYSILIFIRVLLTWVPNIDPYHPAMQLLLQITDPLLEQARRIIPSIGMIDISPIIVITVLSILSNVLQDIANRM